MSVTVQGLRPALADAIAEAFQEAPLACADTVVVGVEPPAGPDLHTLAGPDWEATIAAVRSAFFALQRGARLLVERGEGGCLLAVVPVHALRTSRGCGRAAVAGSFLTTVAQVAAVELGDHGIRVNVIALGPLEDDVDVRVVAAVPLGRLARPADVGAACVMLAGPWARYVSGAVVPLDGGYAVTKAGGGSPFAAA